jgi:hypothetical protein
MEIDIFVDLVFKLANVWSGINGRCNSKTQRGWKEYGSRGITLSKEWSGRQGCIRFVKWAIKNGYRKGLTIDRTNNNKGYSEANCRWVSQKENCWNKSNNRMVTIYGETKCAAEWGEDSRCAVHKAQFQQRINTGWDAHRALTEPLTIRNVYKRKKK